MKTMCKHLLAAFPGEALIAMPPDWECWPCAMESHPLLFGVDEPWPPRYDSLPALLFLESPATLAELTSWGWFSPEAT